MEHWYLPRAVTLVSLLPLTRLPNILHHDTVLLADCTTRQWLVYACTGPDSELLQSAGLDAVVSAASCVCVCVERGRVGDEGSSTDMGAEGVSHPILAWGLCRPSQYHASCQDKQQPACSVS
jgi:hypothetical protein